MVTTTERIDQADDDYFDEDDDICFYCGGEGMVEGSDFGDPMWYDENEFYPCPSCRGSGARKDMTLM